MKEDEEKAAASGSVLEPPHGDGDVGESWGQVGWQCLAVFCGVCGVVWDVDWDEEGSREEGEAQRG